MVQIGADRPAPLLCGLNSPGVPFTINSMMAPNRDAPPAPVGHLDISWLQQDLENGDLVI
ncbi:MAG: hypothetical protein DYH02_07115 [Candidatus Omnitrophica bacterium COP1]|jgi:hypothetical protein|nr:hypothetical protein [Candidatus Omnitrophica bacterium COP1]